MELFYFDGVDDKVVIPFDSSLGLEEYTVSLWYFPERNNLGIIGRGSSEEACTGRSKLCYLAG